MTAHLGAYDPDLGTARPCQVPLITALAGKVRHPGTSVCDFPGCAEPLYSSAVVGPADAPFVTPTDLLDSPAAIHARDSQTDYIALHYTVAALADRSSFVTDEIESVAHLESVHTIAKGGGGALVCASDCVTIGLVERHRPEWTAGLQVLARSAMALTSPFITWGNAVDANVEFWRGAPRWCIGNPRSDGSRAFLGLDWVGFLPLAAYDRIKDMANTAGIPVGQETP